MVAMATVPRGGLRPPAPLGAGRAVAGWLLAIAGPAVVTWAFLPARNRPTPSFEAMTLLALTVACAVVGGLWPAILSALWSTLLLNYFFTLPLHTFGIADPADVATLLLFLAVAVTVASVVDHAARQAGQAREARREADTLTLLNHTLLGSEQTVSAVLELVCRTFAMDSAALLERPEGARWRVRGSVGATPPLRPEDAEAVAPVSSTLALALRGRPLAEPDRRVLTAFAAHLSVVLEREGIAQREAAARDLEAGDRLRRSLLAAVSHDLRTPLAGIKAAVSTLHAPGIVLSQADRGDLLDAIEESTDRLVSIIDNLLDMSRLQAGAVSLDTQQVGLDDVVWRAVASVADPASVEIELPEDLPDVMVDVGLLDRAIANLVQNAVRHARTGAKVNLSARAVGDRVELRVTDHGPGVPDQLKTQLFQPFQRLGDTHSTEGVGLGLAVAKGLTEAQGGRLRPEDTPGGGLTMVVCLPAVVPGQPG